jgi:glycerophosphoryl diester phosphodiesterase
VLTRRRFAAAGLAGAYLAAAPTARAEPPPPMIIADGGAAEERISDTRSAYEQAITEGADFIQATLVPSKEGALVARREGELSASTDVASRPEFADRRATKTIDGAPVTGWHSEDFMLAELQSLYCREPEPRLRPQNVRYDGKELVLSLADVLQAARDGCVRTARMIGVCARLVRPGYYADLGLDVVARLAGDLATAGYRYAAAAIWVEASEPDALRTFGKLSPLRRMRLIGAGDAGALGAQGLADIRAYAEAIGPDQDLLIDPAAATFPVPTALATDAHNASLQVFARTTRPQNQFLPPLLRKGDRRSPDYPLMHGDSDRMLVALFADGVDGLATVLPGQALRARGAVLDAIRNGARRG